MRGETILLFCFLTRRSRNWILLGLVRLTICKRNAFHVTKFVIPRHILRDLTRNSQRPQNKQPQRICEQETFLPLLTLTYMLSKQVPVPYTLVYSRQPLISLHLDGLQLSLWFWFLKLPGTGGWERPHLTRETELERAGGGYAHFSCPGWVTWPSGGIKRGTHDLVSLSYQSLTANLAVGLLF